MSTLPAMPDKWAVKIESEAEAVELQKLFPKAQISYSGYDSNSDWYPFALDFDGKEFTWGIVYYYEKHGYTIYTLNELKELLK
jgi:hypothetical protein